MAERSTRRQFLGSALGLAVVGSTAGCLDVLSGSEPAFLSYKAVEVRWESDRQGYVADLCWLWSDGESRVFGWEPAEYPDIVRSVTDVRVSDATAGRLRSRFVGFALTAGFSSVDATDLSLLDSTLGLTAVSRGQFNRVQFGDAVSVRPTDSGPRIADVESGGHGDPGDWDVEVGTKSLADQFPDKGVPPAE